MQGRYCSMPLACVYMCVHAGTLTMHMCVCHVRASLYRCVPSTTLWVVSWTHTPRTCC